jgi:1-aminocyclopropane-1-carboxylate deaminase/D-cysteine desulfhydrase-like pyridoxal-dependent ACC family enzyme
LAFGGNKTRKLEFLLAEAQAQGARTLITRGSAQSNHCRQTAAAAARGGYDCILILSGHPPERIAGNLLLDHLLNAKVHWTEDAEPDVVLNETFNRVWSNGGRPYLIPYGGSSPVGASAYAMAISEFMEQDTPVDHILFATSSGGTQAGMLVGAHMHGYSGKITGISVDVKAEELSPQIASLATEIADLLRQDRVFSSADVEVIDAYLGAGYGIVGDQEIEAIKLFARLEGLLLDPVYTGRAAAGLIDLIRTGKIDADERVLFWHTGGTPVLFPYTNDLI